MSHSKIPRELLVRWQRLDWELVTGTVLMDGVVIIGEEGVDPPDFDPATGLIERRVCVAGGSWNGEGWIYRRGTWWDHWNGQPDRDGDWRLDGHGHGHGDEDEEARHRLYRPSPRHLDLDLIPDPLDRGNVLRAVDHAVGTRKVIDSDHELACFDCWDADPCGALTKLIEAVEAEGWSLPPGSSDDDAEEDEDEDEVKS